MGLSRASSSPSSAPKSTDGNPNSRYQLVRVCHTPSGCRLSPGTVVCASFSRRDLTFVVAIQARSVCCITVVKDGEQVTLVKSGRIQVRSVITHNAIPSKPLVCSIFCSAVRDAEFLCSRLVRPIRVLPRKQYDSWRLSTSQTSLCKSSPTPERTRKKQLPFMLCFPVQAIPPEARERRGLRHRFLTSSI